MLIASRTGDICAAKLISETDAAWVLKVEKKDIRISKTDHHRSVFVEMADALKWTGAEQELIDHFENQSAPSEQTSNPVPS